MQLSTLNVPISNQGLILDSNIPNEIEAILTGPTKISNVVIQAHGWWESDESAMILFNTWAGNILPKLTKNTLNINIYWPSVLSQNSNSLTNLFQPFTFYSDKHAADLVGKIGVAQILKLISKFTPTIDWTFIGHSFGCRVVCSAAINGIPSIHPINLILIQAGMDYNAFDCDGEYAELLLYCANLRILCTKSGLDTALLNLWPEAMKLEGGNVLSALGTYGPDPITYSDMGGILLDVDVEYMAPDLSKKKLVVADLTSLQSYDNVPKDALSGGHSDINHPEIYSVINSFLGNE